MCNYIFKSQFTTKTEKLSEGLPYKYSLPKPTWPELAPLARNVKLWLKSWYFGTVTHTANLIQPLRRSEYFWDSQSWFFSRNVARVTPYLSLNFCVNCSHLSDNIPGQTQSCHYCFSSFYAAVLYAMEIKRGQSFALSSFSRSEEQTLQKHDVSQKKYSFKDFYIGYIRGTVGYSSIHVTDW